MRPSPIRRRLLAGLVALCAMVACSGQPDASRSVTVFAAASLTRVLPALALAFARTHTDVRIDPVFAGSQILRMQIEHGAPADVFLSAHARHVEDLAAAGRTTRQGPFATNELVIAVPADAPIADLDDLAFGATIVMGTEAVPVGMAARTFLARLEATEDRGLAEALRRAVVSYEPDVRLVAAKVARKEVDAGFVYATNVAADPHLRALPLPDHLRVPTVLHAAIVAGPGAPRPDAASFFDFLLSDEAAEVLADYGFGPPPPP